MSDYMRFKKAVAESSKRKVEDKIIKLMFSNWTCEEPAKKKGWKSIGVSNHWHKRLKEIMEEFEIYEAIPSSGGFRKAEEVKFNYSNLHLFATKQNAIARSVHFK